MNNDKMRAEFEEWIQSHGGDIRLNGEYVSNVTECAWQAWKASRAAQVVELPSGYKYPEGVHYLDKDAVESALDAAGVAYK
jgi:hypothetical protein